MVNQSGRNGSGISGAGIPTAHAHIAGMGNQSINYVGGGNKYGATAVMLNDNDLNQDTYQMLNQQEQLQQYVNYTSINNDNQVSIFFPFLKFYGLWLWHACVLERCLSAFG